MASKGKPVLVTGAHRSGTTWVGRMLAASPSVGYVYEPFNVNCSKELHHGNFRNWFQYVCEENEKDYLNVIEDSLDFRYDPWRALMSLRTPLDVKLAIKRYFNFRNYRKAALRPLIKDPIAIFSAEWLSSKFDLDVLVLIRHPAAFAGSLRIGGKTWEHDFRNFLNQPLLMRDILHPFESEIRAAAYGRPDIVDQAILLWNLIYFNVLRYRREHPEWNYIRHEDLSRNPIGGFKTLYETLGLEFGEHERSVVARHSYRRSGNEDLPVLKSVHRDSLSNILAWKERLSATEISRIKAGTRQISREFYSEEEW